MTPELFSSEVLHRLNLPITSNTIRGLVAFAYQEGGHTNGARFNPFNTMRGTPTGDKDILSVNFATGKPGAGVQSFKNWDDGLEATVRTLSQTNMRPIVDVLRANAPPAEIIAKIAASDWGWWDPKKGRAFLLPHLAADAVVSSASAFESFAKHAYDGGAFGFSPRGMMESGERALKDLFATPPSPKKVGMIVIGVGALAGLAMLVYGLRSKTSSSRTVRAKLKVGE